MSPAGMVGKHEACTYQHFGTKPGVLASVTTACILDPSL
jgi:hypothetical protein